MLTASTQPGTREWGPYGGSLILPRCGQVIVKMTVYLLWVPRGQELGDQGGSILCWLGVDRGACRD